MMTEFSSLERSISSGELTEAPSFLSSWLTRWKRLFIAGQWTDGSSGEVFRTINPATEAELSEVCLATKADVDRAVLAGRTAFEKGEWARLPLKERATRLKRLGDLILTHRAPLAILESLDTGKPIRESFEGDIPRAASNFHFFAEYGAQEENPFYPAEKEMHFAFREPLGVVALITPWNLPLYLETWKIAPCLLMGNSCVLKPSELTPLTASYLTDLVVEAGIPSGVFNLVQGFGENSTGQFLTAHSGVDAISFTGETRTGRAIMKEAAVGPTRVSFELGGKGASIVFEDAPWEAALEATLRASFRNQGEICLACPRIFVHEKKFDEFVEAFVARASAIKLGNPLRYDTQMGALIGKEHFEKVSRYVADIESPAQIKCGGSRPAAMEKGFFFSPTVITGATKDHAISREEVFGPVVCIYPFKDENEVIEAVNATPYGLSASIWTTDLNRATRMSRAVRSGLVWVNCWFVRDLRVPFGGQKRSGLGREGGKFSLDFYSEWKSVCIQQH